MWAKQAFQDNRECSVHQEHKNNLSLRKWKQHTPSGYESNCLVYLDPSYIKVLVKYQGKSHYFK